MYQSYWKLSCLPFENSFAPQFYYRSASHQAALLKLRYCIGNNRGVALLTGDTGLGKTYLVSRLMQEMAGKQDGNSVEYRAVPILFPKMSAVEFLSYLVYQLDPQNATQHDSKRGVDQIVRTLELQLKQLAESNIQPLIIVDEAHLIDSQDVWDCLLLLQNLQQANDNRFSMLLIGDYSLLTQLGRMPAWNERVSIRSTLSELTPAETAAYIHHRLSVSGSEGRMFDKQALEAVYEFSSGIPRRINRLCDMAMLVGFADSQPLITAEEIEAVAEELLPAVAV